MLDTNQSDDTFDLILSLFILNNKFTSAKLLCKKLNLKIKFKFKLDYSHFKHRLLSLNLSNIINIIDLNSILISECITFANEPYEINDFNDSKPQIDEPLPSSKYEYYLFNICYKLINELKGQKNVNNSIIIALCEYVFQNYLKLLNEEQINELKLLELTAKIFNLFLIENINNSQASDRINIEHYAKHYSNPLFIIEQLLMNCKIDTCSKAINLCRELPSQIKTMSVEINKLLVKYAQKALEFRFFMNVSKTEDDMQQQQKIPKSITSSPSSGRLDELIKSKSPRFKDIFKNSASSKSIAISSSLNQRITTDANVSSQMLSISPSSFNLNRNKSNPASNCMFASNEFNENNKTFTMPLVPPKKDQWIKDELANECMVCKTERFTLLNRRHHCRRCGRIVCSNCSKQFTLINDIPQRTCDDCYKQIERLNFLERREKLNENEAKQQPDSHFTFGFKKKNKDKKLLSKQSNLSTSNTSLNSTVSNTNTLNFVDLNEQVTWQLVGEKEKDEEIREKFRYQQAPSTSLCLSILDLHDQPLECGKELLSMCDNLSSYLQKTEYQVEDVSLIIKMIKYLLCNAKIKLLQNSSTNIISLCDTYLSLIDILEQLLLANCSYMPSLYDLRNTESTRRLRNRLLEEERHELAMNLSTKCGLDTQTVWASWGLTELRRGNYKEARSKFDKCLKMTTDKNQSSHQSQMKILNEIISYFETAPPIRITGVSYNFNQKIFFYFSFQF